MSLVVEQPSLVVVEDDRALREFYALVLRTAGYQVHAFADGFEALRHIDTELPALVLLDLNLIGVSGRDVQRELRSRPRTSRVPIIVSTGHDASDLDPSQVACILKKPISAETLRVTVSRCLLRV